MNVASHVFASTMVDHIVLFEKTTKPFRSRAFIRIDHGCFVDLCFDNWAKVLGVDAGDVTRADAAMTLNERIDCLFTSAAGSFVFALAAVFVSFGVQF